MPGNDNNRKRPRLVDGRVVMLRAGESAPTVGKDKTVAEMDMQELVLIIGKLAELAGGLDKQGRVKPFDQWGAE